MWLPTKMYERLPYLWLIAGVLFLAAAFYMSFAYKWSIWYLGAGVSCCVWGLVLLAVRSRDAQRAASDDDTAEAAD